MDLQKEREVLQQLINEMGDVTNTWSVDQMVTHVWKQAKAQAVPEGFGDIQSWIAVNSFSALDASIVDFPVVDANELAKYIDSLIEAQGPAND